MAVAKIYDAELNPTKSTVAADYSGITEILGSYRAVDADDKVGIEILVGKDSSGQLTQLGLTYRDAEMALATALTPMSHSELGQRSVAYLTSDPVAIRELIALILTGGHGADFSTGEPLFGVHGTGSDADVRVADVDIQDHNSYTSIGSVSIDGEERKYQLRIDKTIIEQRKATDGELAIVRDDDNVTLIRLELWD